MNKKLMLPLLLLASAFVVPSADGRDNQAQTDALPAIATTQAAVPANNVSVNAKTDLEESARNALSAPNNAPENVAVRRAVQRIANLCETAKGEYAPRFGREINKARADLIERMRNYSHYATQSNNSVAVGLVKELNLTALIQKAENRSPDFPSAISKAATRVRQLVGNSVDRSQERRLLVAINLYLAVSQREETMLDSTEEEEAALKEEEKLYFDENCDVLASVVDEFFKTGSDATFDELIRALGEVRYYQPDSPSVIEIAKVLRDLFSQRNFFVEVSERFISAVTTEKIEESFPVQDRIREAFARGNGIVKGYTSIDFRPNNERAEFSLQLNANMATKTVSESRGVFVHANNTGKIVATKSIYFNPSGYLTTNQSAATGNIHTKVKSINTDRLTLFGGAIINNKVAQEIPYSERESSNLASSRLASELETRANEQIAELNKRIALLLELDADRLVRKLQTRTTENRLYISCVLGRELQIAAPNTDVDRLLRGAHKSDNRFVCPTTVVSEVNERYGQQSGGVFRPFFRPTSLEQRSNARIQPSIQEMRTATQAAQASPEADESDLIVRFHQSCPNNAACVALSGAVFGPGADTIDDVVARFPGIDANDVKLFLKPYEPKEQKELEPDDVYREVFITFDDVQPFVTRFDNGKINTIFRIASCEVDGKEWQPVEVRLTYRVENRGSKIAFVRENVDVVPDGYVDGDTISARFHAFRRIFIKRMETTIQDEYVAEPLKLMDKSGKSCLGSLKPIVATAENGWLTLKFNYDQCR